jgi:uncharacterized protein with von Willebrand factor type A (vWA) domain
VLLVDVSWSAARAAGLFLMLSAEWVRLSAARARVLLFVDRPVDATEPVRRWLGSRDVAGPNRSARLRQTRPGSGIRVGGRSFVDLLESLPEFDPDAPSDYGRTFHRMLTRERPRGGRHAVLVVLGDGRNNRLDPQSFSFQELTSRFCAALWMVPEPLAEWGSGDSALSHYLPHVDVAVEVSDLGGLARGVAALTRRL